MKQNETRKTGKDSRFFFAYVVNYHTFLIFSSPYPTLLLVKVNPNQTAYIINVAFKNNRQ